MNLERLSQDEVLFLVEQHLTKHLNLEDFTDKEALSAIVRITQGNFQLLMRLLVQIKRILEINQLKTVTKVSGRNRSRKPCHRTKLRSAKSLTKSVPKSVESYSESLHGGITPRLIANLVQFTRFNRAEKLVLDKILTCLSVGTSWAKKRVPKNWNPNNIVAEVVTFPSPLQYSALSSF